MSTNVVTIRFKTEADVFDPRINHKVLVLTPTARRRLLDEATAFFKGIAIDWTQYKEPLLQVHTYETVNIRWERKRVHKAPAIILTDVSFDEVTGEILQAGSNYGDLCM